MQVKFSLLAFKNKMLVFLASDIVFNFHYGGCNAIYYDVSIHFLKSDCGDTAIFLLAERELKEIPWIPPFKNII